MSTPGSQSRVQDSKELQLIQFSVAEVSSEDPDHPKEELNRPSADTRGWQSHKDSQYPQQVILKLNLSSNQSAELFKIQILSHQSKIATRVEIAVADDFDESSPLVSTSLISDRWQNMTFDQCRKIRRLGYVSLDSNERSQYQARELKSVNIGSERVMFIKLIFHDCWKNDLNPFNQVGIVSIKLLGYVIGDNTSVSADTERSGPTTGANPNSGTNTVWNAVDTGTGADTDASTGADTVRNTSATGIDISAGTATVRNAPATEVDTGSRVDTETNAPAIGANARSTSETAKYTPEETIPNTETCRPPSLVRTHRNQGAAVVHSLPRPNRAPLLTLHPDIQSRIDALEQMKRERAKLEDFDGASKLKDSLNNVHGNFSSALQIESQMRKAAAEENYAEASRLKLQRDSARKSAMEILEEAERLAQSPEGNAPAALEPPFAVLCQQEPPSTAIVVSRQRENQHHKPDPFSSTARPSPDRSEVSQTQLKITDAFDAQDAIEVPDHYAKRPMVFSSNTGRIDAGICESDVHPLDGVPGFQECPLPEDISDTRLSSDVLSRIESVLGLYRTKCFFSRNWILRDAVLTKLSLMLPCIDIEAAALALCMILERAINDCVVQVFLTSLIVLDECLSEFEKLRLQPKTVIPMVEKITVALLGKLCDNKPKVSDGAATALLSFALSQCVGPLYIGNYALRSMRPQDAKSGRAVCARLKFLQKLVEEFGDEAVRSDKVIHFIKSSNGFSHKDSDVRMAAKDLTTSVYMLIGEEVLFMLDGLSAKQLQEYKASFISARQTTGAFEDPREASLLSPHPSLAESSQSKLGVTPVKIRGRGRGKRRPTTFYHDNQSSPADTASCGRMGGPADELDDEEYSSSGQDEPRLGEGHYNIEGNSIIKDCLREGRDDSDDSCRSRPHLCSFHNTLATSK